MEPGQEAAYSSLVALPCKLRANSEGRRAAGHSRDVLENQEVCSLEPVEAIWWYHSGGVQGKGERPQSRSV